MAGLQCLPNYFVELSEELAIPGANNNALRFHTENAVAAYNANASNLNIIDILEQDVENVDKSIVENEFLKGLLTRGIGCILIAVVLSIVTLVVVGYSGIVTSLIVVFLSFLLSVLGFFLILQPVTIKQRDGTGVDAETVIRLREQQINSFFCAY